MDRVTKMLKTLAGKSWMAGELANGHPALFAKRDDVDVYDSILEAVGKHNEVEVREAALAPILARIVLAQRPSSRRLSTVLAELDEAIDQQEPTSR